MNKPNLFHFATRELSQDAFLCWLLSWADAQYVASHAKLNATATFFLNRLFKVGKTMVPATYEQVKVIRGEDRIDVKVQ